MLTYVHSYVVYMYDKLHDNILTQFIMHDGAVRNIIIDIACRPHQILHPSLLHHHFSPQYTCKIYRIQERVGSGIYISGDSKSQITHLHVGSFFPTHTGPTHYQNTGKKMEILKMMVQIPQSLPAYLQLSGYKKVGWRPISIPTFYDLYLPHPQRHPPPFQFTDRKLTIRLHISFKCARRSEQNMMLKNLKYNWY